VSVLQPAYPIATARLLLRPYTEDDFDAYHDIQSRPDVVRYLYWGVRSAGELQQTLITKVTKRTAIEHEGDGLQLALELRDAGTIVGDAVLVLVSEEHQQGEIGYVVHPDHQGHGYATEASRVMLRLGFEGLGLHRIVARCDGRNESSWRVMERLGMRREAHLRENEFVKGEWSDELVYAMLASEWQAVTPQPAPVRAGR
jgi:RimJ/RimL family protein N-acetyltransferase